MNEPTDRSAGSSQPLRSALAQARVSAFPHLIIPNALATVSAAPSKEFHEIEGTQGMRS